MKAPYVVDVSSASGHTSKDKMFFLMEINPVANDWMHIWSTVNF